MAAPRPLRTPQNRWDKLLGALRARLTVLSCTLFRCRTFTFGNQTCSPHCGAAASGLGAA
jgi:hypothetical protein